MAEVFGTTDVCGPDQSHLVRHAFAVLKDRHITSGTQVNIDGVLIALCFVILLELASQSASFSPHNRILARVVGWLSIVYFDADQVLL